MMKLRRDTDGVPLCVKIDDPEFIGNPHRGKIGNMEKLDPLRFVKFYASVKHAGQTYSNGLPYTHHLSQVAAVVERFDTSIPMYEVSKQQMLEAAWLHDVIEDTKTKRKDIAEMFGEKVAELVWAVSNEPGENRKVRHALTYPKTLSVPGAVFVKLCDRIANVEAGGDLVQMYNK